MGNFNLYLEERFSQMKTLIDDSGCRPILFVGTGISKRYINAPDWEGLLNEIIRRNANMVLPLGYYKQDAVELPQVASKLVEDYFKYAWEKYGQGLYPPELYTPLYDKSIFLKHTTAQIIGDLTENFQIEGNEYEEELVALSMLTPHAIITTNYDELMEKIFTSYNPIIGQQIIRKIDSSNIGQIYKIHGCITKPAEIVISAEDYVGFAKQRKYLTAKLLTYFIEHPIILLGYSISDPNIKSILGDIADMLCIEGEDEVIDNIWFVEWQRDSIDTDYKPPTEKVISLGDSRSIRVNYILLNSYTELFKTLYQGTYVSIEDLGKLESVIYNIVKSKTVTNLEVDAINIKDLISEESLISMLGLADKIKGTEINENSRGAILNLGFITDPEQVLTRYPFRISDIAKKLNYEHWYHVRTLMQEIQQNTGIIFQDSNSRYHLDVGIGGIKNHRYSMELYELLKTYSDGDSIHVYKEDGTIVEFKKLLAIC